MFALSLIDTLRMTFGQVVHQHKAHTRAARSLVKLGRWLRAGESLLLIGVVIASVGAAAGRGHAYVLTTTVLASVALALFLLHAVFDVDSAAREHHAFASRLWHLREEYRALLSDLNDQVLDDEAARSRRNALLNELHALHQSAPPLGRRVFGEKEAAADQTEESALTDAQIDRFLPKSLHAPADSVRAAS